MGQGSEGSSGLGGEGIHPRQNKGERRLLNPPQGGGSGTEGGGCPRGDKRVELCLKREGEEGWDVGNFLL